jgi:UDP-glucuronate decarboxylase
MRILVTGGAGFLGSHLCKRLLNEGHEVLCLDNFFTGRKKNIAEMLKNPAMELVRHDIVLPILLEVDAIYHLACPASPIHYQYNPVKTIKTNILGTLNMLGVAKRVKARMLLASTSEVYGDPAVHPQKEDYRGNVNPIGIRSCYEEGKRAAETLMMDYHRQNRVDIKIVRIFNTYGPLMLPDDGRVVSNFIVQALKGQDITVYGDGLQTRSFCYVDDLIEGMVRMMECENFIGPVNLGNPEVYTILDLANKIVAMTGSKSKIAHKPLPADDPTQRKPDITLAREKLSWKPKVTVDDGLQRTIGYFKKEFSL